MIGEAHAPGEKRIKPCLPHIIWVVANLGNSLIDQRIPTVPNLQPTISSGQVFVLQNLKAFDAEKEEQELARQDPCDHQPIVSGNAANNGQDLGFLDPAQISKVCRSDKQIINHSDPPKFDYRSAMAMTN